MWNKFFNEFKESEGTSFCRFYWILYLSQLISKHSVESARFCLSLVIPIRRQSTNDSNESPDYWYFQKVRLTEWLNINDIYMQIGSIELRNYGGYISYPFVVFGG